MMCISDLKFLFIIICILVNGNQNRIEQSEAILLNYNERIKLHVL